jgi:hypothetical protein
MKILGVYSIDLVFFGNEDPLPIYVVVNLVNVNSMVCKLIVT